jgi:hypothetical protein
VCSGGQVGGRSCDEHDRKQPAPANVGRKQQRKERERSNLNRQRPERIVLKMILNEEDLREDDRDRR